MSLRKNCLWLVCVQIQSLLVTFSQTQNKQAELSFILALFPNIVCPCMFSFTIPLLLNEVSLQAQNTENLILVLCEALVQISKHSIHTGN